MKLNEALVIVLWIELHNKSKMPGRIWITTSLLNVQEKIQALWLRIIRAADGHHPVTVSHFYCS